MLITKMPIVCDVLLLSWHPMPKLHQCVSLCSWYIFLTFSDIEINSFTDRKENVLTNWQEMDVDRRRWSWNSVFLAFNDDWWGLFEETAHLPQGSARNAKEKKPDGITNIQTDT